MSQRNLIFSLIKLGYLHDPRVRSAIDWITTNQRFADAPTGWPYDPWEMCWGRHTDAATTSRTTPNPAGGGSASRS